MTEYTYQGIIQYCDKEYHYYTYECNSWNDKEKAINELKRRKEEIEKKGYIFYFASIEIRGMEKIKL